MSGYELAILDDWRLKEKMKYERKLALPHKTDGFKIQNDLKSTSCRMYLLWWIIALSLVAKSTRYIIYQYLVDYCLFTSYKIQV